MDYDEILKKIIRLYGVKTENIRLTQVIESKLKKHTATYADAQNYAQAIGKALTEVFREYLPEALTDGKLYRAAAEVLMQQPMVRASRDIDKVAGAIQAEINENAGLGINPIVPEVNQDQIDGIITGICNAESYDAGKEVLFDQVENFMEGHVDDFVRENADFQYQAGLDPKVIRTAAGKCCKWCSNLAGTYKYDDVKDRGNDVWRRHRNCHCSIDFIPGRASGKRARKPDKIQWTREDENARIAYEKIKNDLPPIERGFEEAKVFGKTWSEGSLQEAVARFALNATPVSSDSGRKIVYVGEKYTVGYDTGGNYFRILINSDGSKRPFADLDGNKVLNIDENGKQRGATKPEYEAMTHFRNTDTERRR